MPRRYAQAWRRTSGDDRTWQCFGKSCCRSFSRSLRKCRTRFAHKPGLQTQRATVERPHPRTPWGRSGREKREPSSAKKFSSGRVTIVAQRATVAQDAPQVHTPRPWTHPPAIRPRARARVLRQPECKQTTRQLRRTGERPRTKFRPATVWFALRDIGVSWRFVMTGRYDSAFFNQLKRTKPLILLVKIALRGLQRPTANGEARG